MKKLPFAIVLIAASIGAVIFSYWLPNQSHSIVTAVPVNSIINKHKEEHTLKVSASKDHKIEVPVQKSAADNKEPPQKEVKPWRKPSTQFQPFIELMNKPLVSEEERVRLQVLMNDYALLNTSREILFRTIKHNELDLVRERERLDAVLYLTTILVGKYNSSQQELASELVIEVLNNRTYQDTLSTDLKKSLVGDKVELGLALAVFHPERWSQYKESYNLGEKHQKLVRYIDELAKLKSEQLKDNAERLANRLRTISNS
ncbi:hypothetical protein [Zooshikella harenae]|uniref:Uncharacterized protein n=1 Tax=Zooshikella harenae TaxID=2827238 RepID=A0ABS5ZIA3_9GAMM|nr:hypothetical protein [Zooshikella harenae]MBU2712996.1 hypothetical protein [Zooshikella harenae]